MKKRPPPSVPFAAIVFGLFMTVSAVRDIRSGERVLMGWSGGGRGVRGQSAGRSEPITPEGQPVLFWGLVGLQLALGVPALAWGGVLLFWPRSASESECE